MEWRFLTNDQRLSIVKEAKSKGVTKTIRKYGLRLNGYYYWNRRIKVGNIISPVKVKTQEKTNPSSSIKLYNENKVLKDLVIRQAIRIEKLSLGSN